MADDVDTATDPPNLDTITAAFWGHVFSPENIEKIKLGAGNTITDFATKFFFVIAFALSKVAGPMVAGIAEGTIEGTEDLKATAAKIVGKLFGVSAGAGDIGNGVGSGGISTSVADVLLKGLAGDGSALAPSDANARRFLETSLHIAIDGWAQGLIMEILSEAETVGIVKAEQIGELSHVITGALGLGRLTRRVLGPYINTVAVTPFEWQVNKTYRPKLLAARELARQVARGRIAMDAALEELARQGWSDDRAEAQLSDARQKLGVSDVVDLHRFGGVDDEILRGYLADLGYDDDGKNAILALADTREQVNIVQGALSEITTGYIDGHLDDADFGPFLASAIPNDDLRALYSDVVALRKKARQKRLTKAEIEDAVVRGILSPVDYDVWLEQENYDDQARTVLSLLLQSTVRSKEDADRAKQAKAAADAAKAAQKAVADAAKQAALEAGTKTTAPELSDIKQAVIQGILPIDAYAAALTARKYAPADITFLVALLQKQRDDYVAAQQKRADATRAAAAKNLSLSELDAAVVGGFISPAEYGARLTAAGFAGADVAILQGLVQQKLDAAKDAAAKRTAAAAALQKKGLSLAEEEKAVKAGVQTLDDYKSFLTAQGFNAGDVAILASTLAASISATAAAQQQADQANAQPAGKGLALSQLEAAVVAGIRPIDEYRQLLITQGYDALSVDTLVQLLQGKVDDAAAARAKHAQVAQATAGKVLSLAQVERAVILGTVTMDAYRAYLAEQGYSDDDVALLVGNLTVEIQRAAATTAKRSTVLQQLQAAGVDLVTIENGVLDGSRTMAEYRGALTVAGVAAADVDALVAQLQARVDAAADAASLAANVDAALKPKSLSLAQWEAAVVGGARTMTDFAAFLQSQGYNLADAQVLMTLVAEKLPAEPAPPAPPA